MPSMARRTHVPKLLRIAHALCKAITIATPIIQRYYPEDQTILTLLAAAQEACAALGVHLETLRDVEQFT